TLPLLAASVSFLAVGCSVLLSLSSDKALSPGESSTPQRTGYRIVWSMRNRAGKKPVGEGPKCKGRVVAGPAFACLDAFAVRRPAHRFRSRPVPSEGSGRHWRGGS